MSEDSSEPRKTSLPARVVRAVTSAYFDLIDAESADVGRSRTRLNLLGGFIPVASGVRVEKTEISGLPAEWLTPEGASEGKVLLYLHGGAYVLGGCDSHRHMVSYLARAGNVAALLPEYRLAPEHPFPAAIEDGVSVFRQLLEDGYEASDILISGDSAGGGLAVATMLALRDEGGPMPAAAFLLSPWLDLSASGESMKTRKEHDPWFTASDISTVAKYYCQPDEIRNPLVSPVYADMSGMPPTWIQVGDDEILLSDATRLADKITATGGKADIEVWHGMWHVFQAFLLIMPEARDAIAKMGEQIKRAIAD